jgi:hypothetical protein
MTLRRPVRGVLALAALLAFARPDRATGDEPPAKTEPGAFVKSAFSALQMGDGIQADQVILFPLFVTKDPEPPDVQASVATPSLSPAEPEMPRRRDNLELRNSGNAPLFVAGGTIVEGGLRDRVIADDHVIPPGGVLEVETMPASTSKDVRKDPAPFRVLPMLAPPYLRSAAVTGGGRNLVPTFVSHFLEFRNEKDERHSLSAIAESNLLAEYCLICHKSMASWPRKPVTGSVVGGIAVVRGRVQVVEVFGSNALLQQHFESILKSLSFPAAAIELRAKKAGVPLPGKDDPAKTLTAAAFAAQGLLNKLKDAKLKADASAPGAGESFIVRLSDGSTGRALGVGGRLVHAAVFPDDPFEYALYAKRLRPLDVEETDEDTDRAGLAELERRAALGARLTEAEQRLLERLRGGLGRGGGGVR